MQSHKALHSVSVIHDKVVRKPPSIWREQRRLVSCSVASGIKASGDAMVKGAHDAPPNPQGRRQSAQVLSELVRRRPATATRGENQRRRTGYVRLWLWDGKARANASHAHYGDERPERRRPDDGTTAAR